MTTVASLVYETKEHLYGNYKEIINLVDLDMTSSQVFVPFSDDFTRIAPGTILSIEDELIYVRNATSSLGKADPVIRGFRGTTPAAHAAGTIVEIGSIFSSNYIKRLLQQEILSWPNELFREAHLEIELSADSLSYDLTGFDTGSDDFIFPLGLSYGPDARDSRSLDAPNPTGWRIEQNADPSLFASGKALILGAAFDRTARLTVAQRFTISTFDDDTDLQNDLGVADSMMDIPAYGAAWRAMSVRDAKRSFTESQGEPRKAEEVPPMFQTQVAGSIKSIRDARISAEIKKLRDKWPIMTMS